MKSRASGVPEASRYCQDLKCVVQLKILNVLFASCGGGTALLRNFGEGGEGTRGSAHTHQPVLPVLDDKGA